MVKRFLNLSGLRNIMEQDELTLEILSEKRLDQYLRTRSTLFTAVSRDYLLNTLRNDSSFPVRHYIAGNAGEVAACASFYLRPMAVSHNFNITVAMACAIGTLPAYQRQGIGRKLWRYCEKELSEQADAVAIYTGETGTGFKFYRAMGYEPLFFPRPLTLDPECFRTAAVREVATVPFQDASGLMNGADELFRHCYDRNNGYMGDRPDSLLRWSRTSYFYDADISGATPQFSRLEAPDGKLLAYMIWNGPMEKVAWKKDAVEIWEIACRKECSDDDLSALLSAAVNVAAAYGVRLICWSSPEHFLYSKLTASGFEEQPRNLVVLGKWLDLGRSLQAKLDSLAAAQKWKASVKNCSEKFEMKTPEFTVELDTSSLTRLLFGRTSAAAVLASGLAGVYPAGRTESARMMLENIFEPFEWGYFASEFI